jgi:hypothetical protein
MAKGKGKSALLEPPKGATAEGDEWAQKNIEANLDEHERQLAEAKKKLLIKYEEYKIAERTSTEAYIAFGRALWDVRDDLFENEEESFKGWVEANLQISREYA